MKRVLRSAIDPLPRAVSTKCLVVLVALVVLGTAVTVHRYVESGEQVLGHASSLCPATPEVRASSGETVRGFESVEPTTRSMAPREMHDAMSEASVDSSPVLHTSATPSMFQPEGDSTGS